MIKYWILLFSWAIGVISLFTCMVVLDPPLVGLGYVCMGLAYGFVGYWLWEKD